jgi:hypothetical protein
MKITKSIRIKASVVFAALIFIAGVWTATGAADQNWFRQGPDVEGFQQIIPRGTISSIDRPEFKSATQASIPDSAWILGFEMDGKAYAYDLNLLNAHEVVNHTVGDKPIAAVW